MCDHTYYANMVLAGQLIFTMVGRYHMCDYTYYANMVLAGQLISTMVSRYDMYDCTYYEYMVPVGQHDIYDFINSYWITYITYTVCHHISKLMGL